MCPSEIGTEHLHSRNTNVLMNRKWMLMLVYVGTQVGLHMKQS